MAPNDISVVVVTSVIYDNNRLVIPLTSVESVAAVITSSKIPTKLNENIFTLSCYFMLLLSIIIVMIIIIIVLLPLPNQSITCLLWWYYNHMCTLTISGWIMTLQL